MPIVQPLPTENAPPELQTVFEKSKQGTGSDIMVRTLAHHPKLLQQFLQFYGDIWKGIIDPKLKEMVRYRVAIAGQCHY
jgi:alkylhydroperoxidase family enzyme